MDAAIVAAVASLVVALLTAGFARRESRRAQEAEAKLAATQAASNESLAKLNNQMRRDAVAEENRRTDKKELDRQAEPLLMSALDVGYRINNIRNRFFLETYIGSAVPAARRETAVLSTLYRFASYWAVVEILYAKVSILRFENEETTKQVAEVLKKIGSKFATDSLGHTLMVWREEQRAIAELMMDTDGSVIGYAKFVSDYHERFELYFTSFESAIRRGGLSDNQRLRDLQRLYARLAELLDDQRRLERQWSKLMPEVADGKLSG